MNLFLTRMCLLAASAACVFSQTALDLRSQAKNIDFSGASFTKPSKTGASLPAACSVGETFFHTNAPAGQNLYGCTAANVWSAMGGALTNTGVVPGVYGSSAQSPQITVDAQGRILAATNVPISGGGGGASVTSDLMDCRVTVSGADATVAAPCRVRVGSVIHTLAGSAVATLSGTSASGTVYFYWDSAGRLVADENSSATLSCNAFCSIASGGGFPWGATPIASASFANNVFGAVNDQRVLFATKNVSCGAGLICMEDPLSGELRVVPDTANGLLTKAALQSGQAVRCVSSVAGNAHTCAMTPPLLGYATGMAVEFTASAAAVSGPATLDISGLGAKAIKRADGTSDPVTNEVSAGQQVPLRYDGAVFRLPATGAAGAPLIAPGADGQALISDAASASGLAWSDRSKAGAFGALPTCGNAQNGLVYLLTDSLYHFARCDGSAWSYFHDGRVVTPPAGVWNWDNQTQGGSATIDVSRGFHLLRVPSTHTDGYAVRYQTAPAGSYSRTFAVRLRALWGQSYVGYMVGFRDAGGKLHGLNLSFAAGASGTFYLIDVRRQATAATVAAASFDFPQTPLVNMPQSLYLRIADDTANLSFAYSTDGYDFHTLYTGPRTAYLSAPDQIFLAASAGGAPMGAAMSVISIQ
jgi:hypothetical protein